jgi:hypothetical protein
VIGAILIDELDFAQANFVIHARPVLLNGRRGFHRAANGSVSLVVAMDASVKDSAHLSKLIGRFRRLRRRLSPGSNPSERMVLGVAPGPFQRAGGH